MTLLFNFLLINQSIFSDSSLSHFLQSPYFPTPSTPFSFPSEKCRLSMYISRSWTSSCRKTKYLQLNKRKGFKSRQRSRRQFCSLCQESEKTTKPHNCNTCAEGPYQSHASSLVGVQSLSALRSPQQLTLCISRGVLVPSGSHNLSFPSSLGFSDV